MLHLALSLLSQLGSINGPIFDDEDFEKAYISKIIRGLLQIFQNCLFLPLEITYLTEFLNRFIQNLKWKSLYSAEQEVVQIFLQGTLDFTSRCLVLLQESKDESVRQNLETSLEMLLEMWITLLDEIGSDEPISSQIATWASRIFEQYVQMRLKLANFELNRNEEQENEELVDDIPHFQEQLQSIAYIGRLTPISSLTLMYNYLRDRLNTWKTIAIHPEQHIHLSSIFEELHWIVFITGHLLADEGKGELPEIPFSFLSLPPGNNTSSQ